jgi:hypothetical protein
MTNAPAVLAACYSDYRRVKGRKVHQVVFEIPSEMWPRAYKILGEPSITESAWFALAALTEGAATEYVRTLNEGQGASAPVSSNTVSVKERRRFEELALSQQCALRCEDRAFRRFLEEAVYWKPVDDAEKAAEVVRAKCGVTSRSHLDSNTMARAAWLDLDSRYTAWKLVA